jgi:hypothetical protein
MRWIEMVSMNGGCSQKKEMFTFTFCVIEERWGTPDESEVTIIVSIHFLTSWILTRAPERHPLKK